VKSADADRSVVVISPLSAEARVELFLATASSPAQRLAGMMAAVPVSLPVVHLLQQRLLRDPDPVYIAEVYASGLLTPLPNPDAPAQPTQYDFLPEVRALLNRRTPLDETEAVWDTLSQEIVRSLGLPPIKSFTALLIPKPEWTQAVKDSILPFAQVVTQVLRELGGDYAAMAEMVEQDARRRTKWVVPILETESREFPPLQTLDFITAQLVDGPEPPPLLLQTEQFTVITLTLEPEAKGLEAFEFTVATLRRQQTGILQIRTEWVIQQRQQQAWPWVEPLGDDLVLEMVSIPGGRFLMGSPQNEPERLEWESPQHEVKVADFWMGRYPVTQAQWRFVAGLSRIDRSLDADPSYFKGENRPVETVSWYDATEFCARLSQHTGRSYRLPSEAEWEYACRAGTLTPFHFGEMIIPDLANYAWNETYNKSGVTKKKNFEGTTPVDRFGVANAFGLAEMHGNVWEWCLDHWHENYKGAPTDGSAWHSDNKNARRVRRGGSWNGIPRLCRSAYRFRSYPDIRDLNLGFRVVCVPPRTL
jgi:formylglycine-generating enzyme required for sulfatase activity